MPANTLQDLCEKGQVELMQTLYLQAAKTLAEAEKIAWQIRDFDTLARLYLPLQETRRQIRQRCGDGTVRMHLLANQPGETFDAQTVLGQISTGQLLVAGWASIEPAVKLRQAIAAKNIFAEVFLAAVYPATDHSRWIVLVPNSGLTLPTPRPFSIEDLQSALPANCVIFPQQQLPSDTEKGTAESYAAVMALWEKLHTPMMHEAMLEIDPLNRMQKYRDILQVDPACELAHQYLASIARELSRTSNPKETRTK